MDDKNIEGFWYTQNKEGGVQIYSCDDHICGRFYWLNNNDPREAIDKHNPDPKKRNEPLCKLQFMGNFTPDGHGHYASGWIYDPENGQIFNANMTLVDHDTLDLHGYILLPVLGASQIWKRVDQMPSCENG